jgi:stress response protein YsnF
LTSATGLPADGTKACCGTKQIRSVNPGAHALQQCGQALIQPVSLNRAAKAGCNPLFRQWVNQEELMTTRTVAAMFRSRAEAERAEELMINELNIDRMNARISPASDVANAGYDSERPYQESGLFGTLTNLSLPEEDRHVYAEGMRRNHILLTAQVDDSQVTRAVAILENAGALDLDAEIANWRQSGWTEYDASTHGASTHGASTHGASTQGASTRAASLTGASASNVSISKTATTASAGIRTGSQSDRDEDVIPLVEEKLEVGKRSVERRVQVRTHVVARPVEAEVTLRDETVRVERHQVDRPAAEVGDDAFTERVVEVTETDEVPVVSKTARVVEEITVHKEVSERIETVRDTVRHTEVDIDDNASPGRGIGGTSTGAMNRGSEASSGSAASHSAGSSAGIDPRSSPPDGTPGNPPGTMASRAVDKTLGTNMSGANPAGESTFTTGHSSGAAGGATTYFDRNDGPDTNPPDGTPGNPPGTMASRAVDKTVGTNISGANPAGDSVLGPKEHSGGTISRASTGTHPHGDIPDGAPGNPPGTMASRAVDKTFGTNVSGADPGKSKR